VLLGLARALGQQPPAASPPAIPGNSMSALLRGATSAAGCRGTPACALGAWKTRRRFNTGSCTRRFTHGSVSRGVRWQSSRQPCSRGGSSGGACRSLVRSEYGRSAAKQQASRKGWEHLRVRTTFLGDCIGCGTPWRQTRLGASLPGHEASYRLRVQDMSGGATGRSGGRWKQREANPRSCMPSTRRWTRLG
jgi:hypothetical protein